MPNKRKVSAGALRKKIDKAKMTDFDLNFPDPTDLYEGEVDELKPNATIPVTVDVLNDGLIVVSYTHSSGVYQGVLLRLDRERRIPSGISFPKEFFPAAPGVSEGEVGTLKSELTLTPPLHERHTYFQPIECSTIDTTSKEPTGVTKLRTGLRKFIKPPNKFKNSRMTLRGRVRSSLCARCKDICDDTVKVDTRKPKTKPNLKTNGLSKKWTLKKASNEQVATQPEDGSVSPLPADGQDYEYKGVFPFKCTSHIMEDYWKRPLSNRVIVKLDSRVTPPIPASEESNSSDPAAPLSSVIATQDSECTQKPSENNVQNVLQSVPILNTVAKRQKRKRRKSKCMQIRPRPDNLALENNIEIPSQADENLFGNDQTGGKIPALFDQLSPLPLPAKTLKGLRKRPERKSKKKPSPKESGSPYSESPKRSSTVPARFRDDSYKLTRTNIFNFKRRRGDETDESDGTGERDSALSAENLPPMIGPIFEKHDGPMSDLSRSSISSSSMNHIIGHSNGHDNINDIKKESPSEAKVPVIKITFKSPGNGIVVVPPKEVKAEGDTSESDSKAARKALRKAKKEARRRFIFPPVESDPEILHSVHSNSNNSSPVKSLMDTGLDRLGWIMDEFENDEEPQSPPFELFTPPKKKKKDKKRKRSKLSKHATLALEEKTTEMGFSAPTLSPPHTLSIPETDPSSWGQDDLSVAFARAMEDDQSEKKNLEDLIGDEESELNSSCDFTQDNDESSTTTPIVKHKDTHRLFISLKRTESSDPNSYISCNKLNSSEAELSNSSSNDYELIPTSGRQLPEAPETNDSRSSLQSETHDYPVNLSPVSHGDVELNDSVDLYTDSVGITYRKNDIVWGKLRGCPWWPAKIIDIVADSDDVRAKVTWYSATTLSIIRFSMLAPFESQFDSKFKKGQKRGAYKEAVQAALVELQQMPSCLTPDGLNSD